LQIALGFALGSVAAEWATRPAPNKPTAAQEAIAASVARTVGAPSLAPALYPEPAAAPAGMKAVIQTACAFGNSLTMPLLFMLSLFPASLSSLATGSVALFLLGWSPVFWTLGYSKISGAASAILKQNLGSDEPHNKDSSSRHGML
jgi:auxin efflux carrier family protein